jgi:Flp pilus assembly protein CpaB
MSWVRCRNIPSALEILRRQEEAAAQKELLYSHMRGMTRREIYTVSLGVALGLATCAVHRAMRLNVAGPVTEVDVLVAAHDLQTGIRLSEQDLELIRVEATKDVSHCFDDKATILGRSVLLPVVKGQAICPSDLGGYGDSIPSSSMRAVRTELSTSAALVSRALAKTHVDVLLVLKSIDGRRQKATILRNIPVLAVTRDLTSRAGRAPAEAVTLLLSPDDTAKFAAAKSKGSILIYAPTKGLGP